MPPALQGVTWPVKHQHEDLKVMHVVETHKPTKPTIMTVKVTEKSRAPLRLGAL